MTTRDVKVLVCTSTSFSTYSFLCPACQLLVNKAATEQVVDILVGAGVKVISWTLPAELDEPRIGPPITHDELLGFHFSLQTQGWLEEVVKGLGADPTTQR